MKPSDQITIEIALKAMYLYWRQVYQRSNDSAEIGIALSDLSLLSDGGTADPAAFQDFIDCVAKTLEDPQNPEFFLTIMPPGQRH